MPQQVILRTLERSSEGERILDEFERCTGLECELRDDDRYYEMHDEDHRTRVVQTLTEIDARWTDHVGFKLPG